MTYRTWNEINLLAFAFISTAGAFTSENLGRMAEEITKTEIRLSQIERKAISKGPDGLN